MSDEIKQARNFQELFGNERNFDTYINELQNALIEFKKQANEAYDFARSKGF